MSKSHCAKKQAQALFQISSKKYLNFAPFQKFLHKFDVDQETSHEQNPLCQKTCATSMPDPFQKIPKFAAFPNFLHEFDLD